MELLDPNDGFVQMMYYLYTIEPSIYKDLNTACSTMNFSKLTTLGPYARIIYYMLEWAETLDKKRDDTLIRGFNGRLDGPYGMYSQCFMTFRGVKMAEDKWFYDYKHKVGQEIRMPGIISTFKNFDVALGLSKCSKKYDGFEGKSVLFVFLNMNFKYYSGFRLNTPELSAFPHEQEILLIEGIKAKVISVDENIIINNKVKGLQD